VSLTHAVSSRLSLLPINELVVHGAHYRRVADGTVVDQDAVHCSDGVEKPSRLDLLDDARVVRSVFSCLDVVVDDVRVVAVATLDFRANNRRDLLRRPGRSSSPGEALGGAGNIVYLHDDRARHGSSL